MNSELIKKTIPIIIVFILFLSNSCTPILTQKGGIKSYNLGKASTYDLSENLPRLLRKYQFEIYKTSGSESYNTIETEWKTRYPFNDELEKNITEGRLKLIFRIRKTADNKSFVQVEVENMVMISNSNDWVSYPMTKMAEKDIKRFINEIKMIFDEGRIRRKNL